MVKLFHQTAFPASGIILMDNTFGSCNIQFTDGGFHFHGCFLLITFNDSFTRASNLRAGATAVDSVMQTAFLILPVSFNCGFNICQNFLQYT